MGGRHHRGKEKGWEDGHRGDDSRRFFPPLSSMSSMPTAAVPKLIVFDLDACLVRVVSDTSGRRP